jgi:hypothetical protein
MTHSGIKALTTKGLPPANTRRFCCYNAAVSRTILLFGALLCAAVCVAQESGPQQQKPQMKVNVLNVCTPSSEEQQEIASALEKVPKRPVFSADFEVDRGRSVLDASANPLFASNSAPAPAESAVADFVRMRHDLEGGTYSTVQYAFSRDSKQMVETLVFRVRDPKELLQLSIEDSASSVTPAATMLTSATPASRIKLERFGKPSVVLARCSAVEGGSSVDQSKYEPLFASASALLSSYRDHLHARTLVPEELTRLTPTRSKPTSQGTKHK